ncbi:tRNA (N6-threonylcarbamoyladenosine(37)-N6)-methyltransferase TrmO [Halanaerobium sp. Z-7514]|uniref:tRNA (N6-threonylcarbamoyladenosine(37)-N6)-methyltransferase TrmO n=1 Tax=Halanaerobium polyolivorans TaxID=2886943 RepID=A0AAW4X1N2_9FIRM|nr:tRNA (N6-threonylcarbamoyladenosine(37)-N6)-methyltransferase TrmO [Halanaerobium polyolivorans]MCC3145725.1 tRNA (N6-threonylcarbamoyladenosine(37)-N6)-methyltransferase TrmO [Halanaerobium polyolivorans]RQD69899.1 MAG: tRNA (N6-threonylcarbamoyladenosine(37)-N6)-methyltransferase TrmO [Halanaerobium sp. MSAO_Bac5]
MEITYKEIGKIRSNFKEAEGTPIQPTAKDSAKGRIELLAEYKQGLKDLAGFSHLILLYHCHKAGKAALTVKPFMEDKPHGIFSIRAPSRPNSIGLSVVQLEKIEDNIIYIKDVDILDKTPLLDIKPYVPEFDRRENVKIGWLEKNVAKLSSMKDDGRFTDK